MKTSNVFVTAIAALVLQGCATPPAPYRLYEGEALPEARVARVIFEETRQTQPLFGYWEWVELRALDGRAIEQESRLRREYLILPGIRKLTVRYKYDASGAQGFFEALLGEAMVEKITQRFEKELTLEARQGAEYVLKYRVEKGGAFSPVTSWQVDYSFEEVKADAAVRSRE